MQNFILRRKISRAGGWGIVIIPTLLAVGLGISNYVYVTFGIYLKYQALIDTYNLKIRT